MQTFQLLMLSPNLLKSQIPYVGGGWGVECGPSNFDAESKSAKITNSLCRFGGGGRGVKRTNFQPLSVLTCCESLGCTT